MRIQNKLKMVLNSILLPQHPEHETIFPELMTMIHDLRTLNTLHTEKFLQQCKINENVPSAVGNGSENGTSGSNATVSAAIASNNQNAGRQGAEVQQNEQQNPGVNFEAVAAAAHQRWDSAHLDRDSTGNGSPQSSSGGDTHSSTSLEDTSSRRSPMGSVGSVSSTESSSSSSEVCKLLTTVQDLRMSNNNAVNNVATGNGSSVLMTALTSHHHKMASMASSTASKASSIASSSSSTSGVCSGRKSAESPSGSAGSNSDSGVELLSSLSKPSTNHSLCSSPSRSSMESLNNRDRAVPVAADQKRNTASASPPANEERHPLLKRALQQPPQMFW